MRMTFRVTSLALAASMIAGVAFADAIADRKAAMKEVGGSMALLTKMMKGEEAFDGAKAKAALETVAAKLKAAEGAFPKGSDQGDTKALPKIWEDNAGFVAALKKSQDAVAAQIAAPPKDKDAIKATLGAIGPTCQGCHETYRKPS